MKKITKIKAKAFFWRFVKGFTASGVASALAVLNSGAVINSLKDLKVFGVAVCIAFLTGSMLAIHKMLTWEDR